MLEIPIFKILNSLRRHCDEVGLISPRADEAISNMISLNLLRLLRAYALLRQADDQP